MRIAKNLYYVNQNDVYGYNNIISMRVVNAVRIELLRNGVVLSDEFINALSSNSAEYTLTVCKQLLKDYTAGNLTAPLFKNWESRTVNSFSELARMQIQILGYMFSLSGNELDNEEYMNSLFASIKINKPVFVKLASKQEALDLFKSYLNICVPVDKETLSTIGFLATHFYGYIDFSTRIYSNQVRMAVLCAMTGRDSLLSYLVALKCDPIDALRYAAALVNFDTINLPHDVKYGALSWTQRNELLKFLDRFDIEFLLEELGKNREAWTRFFRHIHLFNQSGFLKYKNINFAARVSCSHKERTFPQKYYKMLDLLLDNGVIVSTAKESLKYRTFASRVKTAIDTKDLTMLIKLLNKKPTYLFKNLLLVSQAISLRDYDKFISFVESLLPVASIDVLFSILSINVDADYRIIDVKGDTIIEEAKYPTFIKQIQDSIKTEIKRRYGFNGKVLVSDELKNKVVNFTARNSELDRGTTIEIGDYKYLYVFVHWIQDDRKRTDLDLSGVVFDSNFRPNVVNFRTQVSYYMVHSGDITNAPAPHGATEYMRFELAKLSNNIDSMIPYINVFTGDNFANLQEAYVGFKLSNSSTFSLSDITRYDLTQPALSNVPCLIDFKKNEILLLDFNSRTQDGCTVYSSVKDLKKLVAAARDKKVITYNDLAEILSKNDNSVVAVITNEKNSDIDFTPQELIAKFN